MERKSVYIASNVIDASIEKLNYMLLHPERDTWNYARGFHAALKMFGLIHKEYLEYVADFDEKAEIENE